MKLFLTNNNRFVFASSIKYKNIAQTSGTKRKTIVPKEIDYNKQVKLNCSYWVRSNS